MQKLWDILFGRYCQIDNPALLYEFYAFSYILAYSIFTHVFFMGFFAYIGVYGFVVYNLVSVALHFLFLLQLNWRTVSQKDWCGTLASLEVIAYGVASTAYFGWEGGSQWFILIAILPHYIFLRTGIIRRLFLTFTGMASLVGVFCYTVLVPSHHPAGNSAAYRFINLIVIAFALLLEAMMGDIVNKTAAGQIRNLQRDVQIDPLTGLWNRRFASYFFEEITREGRPCSVAMLDIDHFKDINDIYGHSAGDEILKRLAGLLKSSFRSSDVIIRWGGEEFLIVLRGSSPDAVRDILENLRATVENTRFPVLSRVLLFTVTIGVARYRPDDGMSMEDAVEESDRYLYQGKRGGRNRVVFPPGLEEEPAAEG